MPRAHPTDCSTGSVLIQVTYKYIYSFESYYIVRHILIRVFFSDGELSVQHLAGYDQLKADISDHNKYRAENRILYIPFTDVNEYLAILQASSVALAPLGARAMLYLAAAVSDFYIPPEQMSVHKIQSEDKLELQLSQVPKLLGHIKHEWAPDAFLVSFKLETDHELMVPKSRRAISKYGVDLVVANELHVSVSLDERIYNELLRMPSHIDIFM